MINSFRHKGLEKFFRTGNRAGIQAKRHRQLARLDAVIRPYDMNIPGLNLTVSEAARQLRVTRVTLSKIINGKSGISPDMALRLAAWLETTPDSWLNMQVAYDLWNAEKKPRPAIVAAHSVHT